MGIFITTDLASTLSSTWHEIQGQHLEVGPLWIDTNSPKKPQDTRKNWSRQLLGLLAKLD